MSSIHDVRYFDSQMTGAPVKDGINAAGKLLQIFDACLVNGFNVRAVTQIVVADGIATATTADADHGYRDYTVIRVWGCNETGLNGDWKSNVSAGNTFSWQTPVADGTYGGAISAKTAPLGWSKPFAAGNVAVYRPGAGLRHYFLVNDTAPQTAYVRGHESMIDATDAGINPFPSKNQVPAGGTFAKYQSVAFAQRWSIFGDGHTMYLIFSPSDNNGVLEGLSSDYAPVGFGELISYVPGDAGHSFLAASIGDYNQRCGLSWPGFLGDAAYHYGGFYLSRPFSQILGAPTRLRCAGSGLISGWGSSSDPKTRTPTPNPSGGELLFHHPVLVQEEVSSAVRGELPGLWQPLCTSSLSAVGSVFEVSGRKILAVRGPDVSVYGSATTNRSGVIGVDITGPWR